MKNLIYKKLFRGFLIKGTNKGPKSIIIAGMHGDEPCGVHAFLKILPKLQIDNGEVTFLIGNPKALGKNIRFTEYNLNRALRNAKYYSKKDKETYEYKRAQFLKKIMLRADVALDLHSTRNPGKPFIICENNAFNIVDKFPENFVRRVSGFAKIEPGATDDFMNDNGKIGIGIECGQHDDPNAVNVAISAIDSFLHIRGHFKKMIQYKKPRRQTLKINKLYKTRDNFVLTRVFQDFETIKAGTVVGYDAKRKISVNKKSVILFAHNCSKQNEEAFLLADLN